MTGKTIKQLSNNVPKMIKKWSKNRCRNMIEKWSSAPLKWSSDLVNPGVAFSAQKTYNIKEEDILKEGKHTEKTFFRRGYSKGRQCTLSFRHALGAFGPGADFWAENVAPKLAFGTPLGRQGSQKSRFLAKNLKQISKKSFQEGFQKKHAKIIKK